MPALNETHSAVVRWLGTQQTQMLELLEELVNIDSGSYDVEGVDKVGQVLWRFLLRRDVPVLWNGEVASGRTLCAGDVLHGVPDGHVLLLGHRDTVFPRGEAARRPFKIANGRAYGPGVADMKAGLVMNAFVLAAFARFMAPACPPIVALFTVDEEIGSKRSREVITSYARGARAAFNAEPGRPNGNVVTSRKGGAFLRVDVCGKAAHAGNAFAAGRSAIHELAHKVVDFTRLIDLDRGTTLNVGVIEGGQGVNTVASRASAKIDIRYATQEAFQQTISGVEKIARHATVDGTSASIEVEGMFDAFVTSERSARLFDLYASALSELGVLVQGEYSGGCSDSGITSNLDCPTVCAVGPVGGHFHTPEEYMDVDSLVPRAQGLALALARLMG